MQLDATWDAYFRSQSIWLCSIFQLPANADPRRYHVMAQIVGSLPLMLETQIGFPAAGFNLAQSRQVVASVGEIQWMGEPSLLLTLSQLRFVLF